jgi:hexosaminidase
MQSQPGHFRLDACTRLQLHGKSAQRAADYLLSLLRRSHDLVLPACHHASGTLLLQIDAQRFPATTSAEAYRLDISTQQVKILAPDKRGLLYGAISLWQLATANTSGETVMLPAVHIEGAPRFPLRGYMLDSARQFQSMAQTEQLLDAMAIHKLALQAFVLVAPHLIERVGQVAQDVEFVEHDGRIGCVLVH